VLSKRTIETFNRIRGAGRWATLDTKNVSKDIGETIFSKMYPEDDAPLFSDTILSDEAANLIIVGSDPTAMALIKLTFEVSPVCGN
jgi:hypothetical protein